MLRVALCLLVVAVALSPSAAAATATLPADTAEQTPANETATPTPEVTVVDSDGTFAGFTLGAAVLAVVAAGTYRYLRD